MRRKGKTMRDAVKLLTDMVRIESHSGEEEELARFLVEDMAATGMEAYIDEAGNAVGIRAGEGAGGDKDIVLLGHMDTVTGEVPVRREEDLLYGRGAVDAKGPLATFICAARELEPPPGWRVVVIGAVEEESATSKGARQAAKNFAPVACVIGEPSAWDAVTLGYKGRILAHVEIEREMSHTAGPGTSATEMAVEWWNELRVYADEFNAGAKGLFDALLPSLRDFGRESDGLTETAWLEIGVRLPLGFDIEAFKTRLREYDSNARVEFRGYEEAYAGERTSPLVRAFNTAIRSLDVRPRQKYKTGTSDMNVVGPRWRCPILAYGPGDSSLDHTPNEHISIEEYLRSIEVLKDALAREMNR